MRLRVAHKFSLGRRARARGPRMAVVGAEGLYKRDLFALPDPFAIVTVDGEQTKTTDTIKRTLSPYWGEEFEVYDMPRSPTEPRWQRPVA